MSEPITSELRAVVNHTELHGVPLVELGEYEFGSRCDAIDAVHANLERENESLRRELDRVLGEEHDFAPESHYMMLPKDADGEPVNVGDVMEWCDGGHEPFKVVGIGDNGVLFYDYGTTSASDKRHHTRDTWERIIADAAATRCDFDDLVARCRALAGGAA